ncbi:MAG: biotin--[acetyl-CoA-carboxylase] ligase [Pseudomonadota bacterium]
MVADLILDRQSLARVATVEIRSSISSTMNLAHHWIKNSSLLPALFVADHQKQGRGRFQRTWVSPSQSNLYFTLLMPLKNMHPTFSLMIGLSIAEILQDVSRDQITVKWPNDVMIQQKKLAGILIELHSLKNNPHYEWCAAIGIGINVQRSEEQSTQLTRPWITLSEIWLEEISRGLLLTKVVNELLNAAQSFELYGWASLQARWQQRDALFNQHIKVSQNFQPNMVLEGTAKGVDNEGRLIIISGNKQHILSSGEVWTFQQLPYLS